MGSMDQEFRWVKALAECSPFQVLKFLQDGCQQDVQDRNEQRSEGDAFGFKITSTANHFRVLREGNRISSSVKFEASPTGISVSDDNDIVILQAILTVNDEGQCRLRIGNDEVTFWQFRRRALQDLFFKF